MFTNVSRFMLAVAALIAAVATYDDRPLIAGMFVAGGLLLSIGYVRHATVWLAFRAQKQGRTDGAKKLLEQVANPSRLSPQSRAYYYLLRAIHAIEAGEYAAADMSLANTSVAELRTDNDRSMAVALRAAAAMGVGDRERAITYLMTAKQYPRRAEITALLEKIEAELAGAP